MSSTHRFYAHFCLPAQESDGFYPVSWIKLKLLCSARKLLLSAPTPLFSLFTLYSCPPSLLPPAQFQSNCYRNFCCSLKRDWLFLPGTFPLPGSFPSSGSCPVPILCSVNSWWPASEPTSSSRKPSTTPVLGRSWSPDLVYSLYYHLGTLAYTCWLLIRLFHYLPHHVGCWIWPGQCLDTPYSVCGVLVRTWGHRHCSVPPEGAWIGMWFWTVVWYLGIESLNNGHTLWPSHFTFGN